MWQIIFNNPLFTLSWILPLVWESTWTWIQFSKTLIRKIGVGPPHIVHCAINRIRPPTTTRKSLGIEAKSPNTNIEVKLSERFFEGRLQSEMIQPANQPSRQAARQANSQAGKQPGRQTARQPGSQAARQPGSQAARQQARGSQAAGSWRPVPRAGSGNLPWSTCLAHAAAVVTTRIYLPTPTTGLWKKHSSGEG